MLKRVLRRLARGIGIESRVNRYLRGPHVETFRINGVEVRIPSFRGISCTHTEPWMTDLLAEVLQGRSGAFLDVGVNLGQTLIKVRALDPHRAYVGFEPNPLCVSYVHDLIKENAFENCTLLPVGLFTDDCVLSLNRYSDDPTDSSASLIEDFRLDRGVRSRVFVPVFKFGTVAKLLGDAGVGIVKIDVEGAELEVVQSLLELIKRDRPVILMEVLPVYSDDNSSRRNRQLALERILADADYAILRVEKTVSGDYDGLKHIESIGIHSDLTQCDYVAVPSEQLAKLKMTV